MSGHQPLGRLLSRAGALRGALAGIAARGLDLPSRYGFHLLIAAMLGVEPAGQFYIVFSVMTALGGLGRLGIDRALTRTLAMALANGRNDDCKATIGHAVIMTLTASCAMALALFILSGPFARTLLGKPALAAPLALGALAIVPQNLGAVMAGALAGFQRIGLSQMIYSWLWPACFCATALFTGLSLDGALVLIATSFALAALAGALLVGRILPTERKPTVPTPPLLRQGLSLFTLELTQLTTATVPPLLLGVLASDRDVGLFALAWRIALLINVVVSGISAMAAPRYAALHAQGDRDGLARTSAMAIGLCLVLATPAALVMLGAPTVLLSLFGNGYADGASVLRLLTMGQVAAALSVSLPELLGMTGHLRDLRRVNGLSLAVLLAAGPTMALAWRAEGVALAVALSLAASGAGAAYLVRRRLALSPWRIMIDVLDKRKGR